MTFSISYDAKKKRSNTSCDKMISCKATGKVQLELSFKNLEVGNIPEMSTENGKF